MKFTTQSQTPSLLELYNKHKRGDWPDKNSVHSYVPVYEEILAPYRDNAKNILEIGLMSGESLRMWDEYFKGDVYGMDCSIKPVNGLADLTGAMEEGYNIFIGDASSPADVAQFWMKFDVVIEDANHDLQQQLAIYAAIKPYLNDDAIYIIEDIQDINRDWEVLKNIDPSKELTVIDRRNVKGRYDDVLIIIK